MGWQAWFTAAVLLVVLGVLLRERLPAPIAILGGVVTFVLTGILTPAQAFAGFSSEAPITIAALLSCPAQRRRRAPSTCSSPPASGARCRCWAGRGGGS